MNSQIHISSIIIYVRATHLSAVAKTLSGISACDIVASDDKTKFVAVLETAGEGEMMDTIDRINAIDGIVNTVMAYHHYADEATIDEILKDEVLQNDNYAA